MGRATERGWPLLASPPTQPRVLDEGAAGRAGADTGGLRTLNRTRATDDEGRAGPTEGDAVGILATVETVAVYGAMGRLAGRREAFPRVPGVRGTGDLDTPTTILPRLTAPDIVGRAFALPLLALTDAGAALPIVLAEVADVDAAEVVQFDLFLFLMFVLFLGVGETGKCQRAQSKCTRQRTAREERRDRPSQTIEACTLHGTSVVLIAESSAL
jgi:hypothetical protein